MTDGEQRVMKLIAVVKAAGYGVVAVKIQDGHIVSIEKTEREQIKDG